jgi:hypothetical protein
LLAEVVANQLVLVVMVVQVEFLIAAPMAPLATQVVLDIMEHLRVMAVVLVLKVI